MGFPKTIIIFHISTPKFHKIQVFMEKDKNIKKFRTKISLFSYFGDRIWEHSLNISNPCLRLIYYAKFHGRNFKFWYTFSNTFFGYFYGGNEKTNVVFLFRNLTFLNYIVLCKKKLSLNLVSKLPYWGIFGLRFWNTIVIFDMGTFKFVKPQSFVNK